jgi:hypothetical protein
MPQKNIRRVITFFILALVSATISLAQSPTSTETTTTSVYNTWQVAQQIGSPQKKLFVVTLDQPHRRRTCRIRPSPWTSSSAPAPSAVLAPTSQSKSSPSSFLATMT